VAGLPKRDTVTLVTDAPAPAALNPLEALLFLARKSMGAAMGEKVELEFENWKQTKR